MIATKIKENLTRLGCHLKLKLGYQAKGAARWLLQVYQQQDNLEEFLRVYEPAIALNSEDETLLLEAADFLRRRQQNNPAIVIYQRITNLNPSNFLAHRDLGDLLLEQQRWYDAEHTYQQALQLVNSPSPFLYRKLAKTLAQQQRWPEALAAYEQGWDRERGSYQDLQTCKAQVDQHHETWETYELLFQTLAEAKQWTGAIAAWWKAVKLNPYEGWWRFERCLKISKRYQKLEDLEQVFRQAFKNSPGELDLGLNLSAILETQGRMPEVYATHQEIANYKLKQRFPQLSPQIPLNLPQVDFTIIGAQKSGTSSLYYYLEEHPDISVSIKKELHFWSLHYEKGQDWYLSHFLPIPEGQSWVTGEASPTYLDSPKAAERMYRVFPEMKLIVLLRNPVTRAISHYHHWVRLKKEFRPLDVAFKEQLQNLPEWDDELAIRNHYIARSCYSQFLPRWLDYFPRKNCLVLASETFQAQPSQVLQTIHSFLGIPKRPLENREYYNVGDYQFSHPSLQQDLEDFYHPYNQQLEQLLGQSFPWTRPPETS
ncbi:tetratricopeptide repeat-containing sulfotransferase family protein [Geitlerinema sp. P-1104]|uniref:tetratricopeptide repeat-containing sulfotransferase family protein n=1 Tax=Geitlerinema sp. P-1104 TaxID=2546230 RepID=UPI001476B201|nr:tetratricopeptide repeat-containing sulfotransferase family protein [Geitlerinema sp. P-1104]